MTHSEINNTSAESVLDDFADKFNLIRFVKAQQFNYDIALREVEEGEKNSHWIWYIFPQLAVLGYSYNAKFYGLSGYDEAKAYLNHPILGERLRRITMALLEHKDQSLNAIFGGIDAMKVCSCMTLFDIVSPDDIFEEVLDVFCDATIDSNTIAYL